MTIIPALIYALILYTIYGYLVFNPLLKQSSWVLWLGLICALVANFVWIKLATNTLEPLKLLQYGLYWDLVITSITIMVPIFLFKVEFSYLQLVGLFVTIIGLVVMKLGGT